MVIYFRVFISEFNFYYFIRNDSIFHLVGLVVRWSFGWLWLLIWCNLFRSLAKSLIFQFFNFFPLYLMGLFLLLLLRLFEGGCGC
jgi:hypothetical protein